MNKQSNIYTIAYITVIVVIVGAALAFAAMSLRPKQIKNEEADKMRQILASVHIVYDAPADGQIAADFNKYITEQYIIDSNGAKQEGAAFDINVGAETKKDGASRQLPVYVCDIDGENKYILPLYGAGLWGPIWGYVSFNADGKTIYGAYFAHQGETPGLGAEIDKLEWQTNFDSLQIFKDGKFLPIEVVKTGQSPKSGADYVDGISGGTITSKGVSAMLSDCLTPYKSFLESLSDK